MNNSKYIKNLQANAGKYFSFAFIWGLLHIVLTISIGMELFGNGWGVCLAVVFDIYAIYKMIVYTTMLGKMFALLDLLQGKINHLNGGTNNEKEGNQ